MSNIKNTIIFLIMIFIVLIHITEASVIKWLRVNNLHVKVLDNIDVASGGAVQNYDGFVDRAIWDSGWSLGTRDWTDDQGTVRPFAIAGGGQFTADEFFNTMPISDENNVTIKRYFRYQPPSITVDGFNLEELFPQTGDEVNPNKIPGTADVMVESKANTFFGVTIHQKVLAWSQEYHDDYVIFDFVFKNTGNIDTDEEVELPNQTLNDVYFMKVNRGRNKPWHSSYGQFPGDSLRMIYMYPQRSPESTYDDFGEPTQSGFLEWPHYIGIPWLYVSNSTDNASDDQTQPHMTGVEGSENSWIRNDPTEVSAQDRELIYQTMSEGFLPYNGTPYMGGAYADTHHGVRPDEAGVKFARELSYWNYDLVSFAAAGPYTLAPGDSFRVVYAIARGSISRTKGWEIGRAWNSGQAKWDGEDDTMPHPQYQQFPDLAPTPNDKAKDLWVATGLDSLFRTVNAAQWAVKNNYNVPIPPPPPSLEVKSLANRIQLTWGEESETDPDFGGYRVYRAIGNPDTTFNMIFECGDGTNNALTHTFDDTDALRGQAYYYYVTAFDKGKDNTGVDGKDRNRLESGPYLNRTSRAAYLTREAGSLSDVRVVPNPYNISARQLQFVGEPDKIMFMNLPRECIIRIYTERGDLVRTIIHNDGSGDEPWGNILEEHSATEAGQIISSGIYIAHIENPEGESQIVKFLIVR